VERIVEVVLRTRLANDVCNVEADGLMALGDRLFDFFQRSTVLRGQDQTLAQLRQAAPWPWLGAATFTAPQGGVGACTEKITRRVCAGPDDRRSARCPYYGNKGGRPSASERKIERYIVGFPCTRRGLALMHSRNPRSHSPCDHPYFQDGS